MGFSAEDQAIVSAVRSGHLDDVRACFAAERRDANLIIPQLDYYTGTPDPNRGITLLQFALEGCRSLWNDLGPLIRYLASQGADMNKAGPGYITPSLLSITMGNFPEEINALIDCGADVNVCLHDTQGMTMLIYCAAYHYDRTQIARLLVRRGADVFLCDDGGEDAEDHARNNGHYAYTGLEDFLADVKRAGSYRKYLKEPRVELARLRLLCVRGRATPLADPALARLFDVPNESMRAIPKEVFWHVLAYWRSSRDDE